MDLSPALLRTPPSSSETQFIPYAGPPFKPRKRIAAKKGATTREWQGRDGGLPAKIMSQQQIQNVDDDFIDVEEILRGHLADPEIPETQYATDEAARLGSVPDRPVELSDSSDMESSDNEVLLGEDTLSAPLDQSADVRSRNPDTLANPWPAPYDSEFDAMDAEYDTHAPIKIRHDSSPPMHEEITSDQTTTQAPTFPGSDGVSAILDPALDVVSPAEQSSRRKRRQVDLALDSEHDEDHSSVTDGSARPPRRGQLLRFDVSRRPGPSRNLDTDVNAEADSHACFADLSTADQKSQTNWSKYTASRRRASPGGSIPVSSGGMPGSPVTLEYPITTRRSRRGTDDEPLPKVGHARTADCCGTTLTLAPSSPGQSVTKKQNTKPSCDSKITDSGAISEWGSRSGQLQVEVDQSSSPDLRGLISRGHEVSRNDRAVIDRPASGVQVELLPLGPKWQLIITSDGVHSSDAGLHNPDILQFIEKVAGSEYSMTGLTGRSKDTWTRFTAIVCVQLESDHSPGACRYPSTLRGKDHSCKGTVRPSAYKRTLASIEQDMDSATSGDDTSSASDSDVLDSPTQAEHLWDRKTPKRQLRHRQAPQLNRAASTPSDSDTGSDWAAAASRARQVQGQSSNCSRTRPYRLGNHLNSSSLQRSTADTIRPRTGAVCRQRRHLSNGNSWSEKDDDRLRRSLNSKFDWEQLRVHFAGRSRNAVYQRRRILRHKDGI